MRTDVIDSEAPVSARVQGVASRTDGETWTAYAVFPRAAVEWLMGGAVSAENADEVARELTGWEAFSRGPGRAFAHAPRVRLFRHAILVTQFGGLDI